MPQLIRSGVLVTEMATRLSDLFRESQGAPVEVDGQLVQMMYELDPIVEQVTFRFEFADPSPACP